MILLVEYYKPNDASRDVEYLTCLNENINSGVFSKVVIFIDDKNTFISSDVKMNDSVSVVYVSNRLTYSDFFRYCNEHFSNDVCVLSNTDIIFDNTISSLNDVDMSNRVYCLTRWDLYKTNNVDEFQIRFFDVDMSQDCWIFRGDVSGIEADFTLGKPGCDNKIAYLFLEGGYTVYNPSRTIVTKHLHISSFRTYTHRDTINGPYMLLIPNSDINTPCDYRIISSF